MHDRDMLQEMRIVLRAHRVPGMSPRPTRKGADAFSAATGHTLGGSSSGAGVSLLEGSALLATSPRVPWRFAELCMRRLRLKRMMRARNRKFADSSLEETVRSEPVSEAQIPCYLGKYRQFCSSRLPGSASGPKFGSYLKPL